MQNACAARTATHLLERGVICEVDGFFEVTVFILRSMFWRAAQNPSNIRAGASARSARASAHF